MKTWFWKEKCLHKERWTDYIPTDSFMSTKITGTFLLYSQMSTVGKPTQLLGDSSQKKKKDQLYLIQLPNMIFQIPFLYERNTLC